VGINEEDLEREPVSIAEGIYWVGYSDKNRGLHCNPYLIIEGDEAVLIDGGNRDDFSTVRHKRVEPYMVLKGKFPAIMRYNAREYIKYSLRFCLFLRKICSFKTLRPCP
jgi:hypothetical protein